MQRFVPLKDRTRQSCLSRELDTPSAAVMPVPEQEACHGLSDSTAIAGPPHNVLRVLQFQEQPAFAPHPAAAAVGPAICPRRGHITAPVRINMFRIKDFHRQPGCAPAHEVDSASDEFAVPCSSNAIRT
jgi:hypothetical protein